jgi:hypothetical protein
MFPMFPSFRPPSRPASEPMLPSHPPSAVSAGRLTSRGSIVQVQQSRAGNEIMTYSLAGIVEPTEVSLPRVLQHLLQPLDHPGAFLVARARATPAYARRRFPHIGASSGSLTAPFEAVSEWLERRVDRTAAAGPHPTRRHDAAVDDRAGGACARRPGPEAARRPRTAPRGRPPARAAAPCHWCLPTLRWW